MLHHRSSYLVYFGFENRTGYETLLYDSTMRDPSLFKRADMIEGGWTIVQPILDTWASGRGGILHKYSAGSEEPAAAGEMLERDGRRWKDIRI